MQSAMYASDLAEPVLSVARPAASLTGVPGLEVVLSFAEQLVKLCDEYKVCVVSAKMN